MPLTLEEETELLPLVNKASDLMVKLILKGELNEEANKKTSYLEEEDKEFHKIVERISAISPLISGIYLDWYNKHIPNMKSMLADWGKDNI
jgi:hypothetical protein